MARQANGNAAGAAEGATARAKRNPWRVVFAISLVVLIASLVALGVIWFSYFQGQQKYGELAEYADLGDMSGASDQLASLDVDWDSLRAINPDIVAWVYIPGTPVNYPVVRGSDNDYYLTHDFDGDQGWLANYGAIFMEYTNRLEWVDDAYFVYGHHMNDGSMFASIADMHDQGRFDACRTVYLLTPQMNLRLRSFALVRCDSDEAIVQTMFNTLEDRAAYVQDKLDRSVVNVGVVPEATDISKVFAFTTCDNYDDGRYVLFTYIEGTTVEGLVGVISANSEEGVTSGLADAR